MFLQNGRDPPRIIEWMADSEPAAVEVYEDGSLCVWLFFVFAWGEKGSCCGEEVELDRAGEFADCAGDGEFQGWAGGERPGEVAV